MNSNKIAIITGASTGIGKHISIKLAENNHNVILISRSKNKLVEVEKKIKSLGKSCQLIVGDISKESTIKNIFSQINEIKNIDVLINNAGIGIFNKIENISCKEWDKQLNTNLKGSFLMTRYIVPQMIKNKTGKIVFINSIAGINAYPYSSAYVASKFGLRGFSSSLREELREHNIKVISIHPGAVNTPFWNNVKADFPREQMLSSIDVASSIVNAVMAPNNVVQEEIVIRRTGGDF